MLADGVTLRRAVGAAPAREMAEMHRVSATAAYAHIFDTAFPVEESRRKWAAHAGEVWLAWRRDALVGFATSTGDELDGLYVLPAESGRGIGSALLAALPDVSRLWVLEENVTGRAFYEHRGWRARGERREAYGVWELLYVRQASAADTG